jgi:xylan 1,4-beta-xylosidase
VSPAEPVDLVVSNIPSDVCVVTRHQIDQENSNSYELWKKMGSPQEVTDEQYRQLEAAGKLKQIDGPTEHDVNDGKLTIQVDLEGQAVTFFLITWQ